MALEGVFRFIFNFFCRGFAIIKNLRRFAFHFKATLC
jgi:hypothetical protein